MLLFSALDSTYAPGEGWKTQVLARWAQFVAKQTKAERGKWQIWNLSSQDLVLVPCSWTPIRSGAQSVTL